jgi:hypothetical protein
MRRPGATYDKHKAHARPWQRKVVRIEVGGDVAHCLELVEPRQHFRRRVAQNELAAAELKRPPAALARVAPLRHQRAQVSDVWRRAATRRTP